MICECVRSCNVYPKLRLASSFKLTKSIRTVTLKNVPLLNVSSGRLYATAEANDKYRVMFETQKSGNKTSSGEIGLDIRTYASPKVGQDQVSGGVSVPCLHATPVAQVPPRNLYSVMSNSVRSQTRERDVKWWCEIQERSPIR